MADITVEGADLALEIGSKVKSDFDKVELSNLQRQILHNDTAIGMNKAKSAKYFLGKLNPNIKVEAIEDKLDMDSMKNIARSTDVIIDCSDNFYTRYRII